MGRDMCLCVFVSVPRCLSRSYACLSHTFFLSSLSLCGSACVPCVCICVCVIVYGSIYLLLLSIFSGTLAKLTPNALSLPRNLYTLPLILYSLPMNLHAPYSCRPLGATAAASNPTSPGMTTTRPNIHPGTITRLSAYLWR